MEELKLNITTENKEVIIRTGKVEETIYPIPVSFEGILSAPGSFLENRKSTLDISNCRLEVDYNAGKLTFYSDEKNKFRDQVVGKLIRSKVIDHFGINSETKSYTDKSLAKFLRTTAFYFPDQSELNKIIEALMKFQAKVNVTIENKKDLKGNAKEVFEMAVKHDIPSSIMVKIPIFEGYPEQTFKLEIGAEASSASVTFFFESQELYMLEDKFKRSIIAEEVAKFEVFGCVILNK